MRLCIDASNLRTGGGVTHLIELLRHGDPGAHGFERVFVWAAKATLDRLPGRPWLVERTAAVLEQNYLARALWQRGSLGRLARADGCSLLFVPGGSFATGFRPVVTMSRNMLPFEPAELRRYGLTGYRLKLQLLRWTQGRSLRLADGRIFLSAYAHETILRQIGPLAGLTEVIPHGVDERFQLAPRRQRPLEECSLEAPFRLLYVSTVDTYKHHGVVAEAVAELHASGLPVSLDLVGGAHPPALRDLHAVLQRLDPHARFITYHGAVPYDRLHDWYAQADAAVFASSCENMPNTLLEKMAAALPVACSNRGPMPEVLGDAGLYFDPESRPETAAALRRMLDDAAWRARAAAAGAARARTYSWRQCAARTFDFLRRTHEAVAPQLAPAGAGTR